MLDAIGVDDEGSSTSRSASRSSRCSSGLPPREKKILLLRFFKNMTQSQIAEEIGVSQMHVSRLLNRTLEQLRASLERGLTPDGQLVAASSGERRRCCRGGTCRPARRPRPRRTTATAAGVSPPRKLQASPSQISWVSSTGPRAQDARRDQRPRRTSSRTGAVRRRRRWPWSTPIATRSASRLASSSTAKTSSRQPLDGDQGRGHGQRGGRLAAGRRLVGSQRISVDRHRPRRQSARAVTQRTVRTSP